MVEVTSADETSSRDHEFAELKLEIARLENRLKENQTSLFGAIKTLLTDLDEYREGKRDFHSLRPATLGLLFAYLRPRLVIVIGSLLAGLLGIAQLWFLWNQQKQIDTQNKLIAQQGQVLEAQTKASQVAAISELVLALDPRDSIRSHLAQVQLANFGEIGIGVLMDLSESEGSASDLAARALYSQAPLHTPAQAADVLSRWLGAVNLELAHSIRLEPGREDDSVDQSFLQSTEALLVQYVDEIVSRSRRDSTFEGELKHQLLTRETNLPVRLGLLYSLHFRACALDPGTCAPTPDRMPDWHTSFYELATSFRENPREVDAEGAYLELGQALGEQSRSRLILGRTSPLVRSWFGDETDPTPEQK